MEELKLLDEPIKQSPEAVEFECDFIKADDDIGPPPFVLWIDGIGKLTKGDISAWKGFAKSKKTYALKLVFACIAAGGTINSRFKPLGEGKLGWVDTEQSPYDAQRVPKHIKALCGSDDRLLFLALRRYSKQTRLQKVRAFLEKYGHEIEVLVVDGIRDLVTDFNDLKQSGEMVDELMRWSIDYDLHVSVVLHANKSDSSMRGHLGTELENKSQAVFAVKRDEQMKNVSHVELENERGKNVDGFAFQINAQGLPEFLDGTDIEVETNDAPY